MFDEAARRAGPLNGLLGTPNDYAWSPDNSAEVDRGWYAAGAVSLAWGHLIEHGGGLTDAMVFGRIAGTEAAARAAPAPGSSRAGG